MIEEERTSWEGAGAGGTVREVYAGVPYDGSSGGPEGRAGGGWYDESELAVVPAERARRWDPDSGGVEEREEIITRLGGACFGGIGGPSSSSSSNAVMLIIMLGAGTRCGGTIGMGARFGF